MKFLNIGCDKAIMDPASDVRQRILEYGKIVEAFHVHTICKTDEKEISISENVWIHPRSSWFRTFLSIGKIIREKKIDVIVSPDPFAKAWVCVFFALIYRKKLLLSVYGGNIFDKHWKKLSILNGLYSWIGRIVFSYAHAIQTDGLETLDVLVQKYGKKVFWKPMVPANINELSAINRIEQEIKVKPTVLYVGRLIGQKNIPFLARVIKEVQNDARVVVVGDGPLKHLLDDLNIVYYSKQNREEIVERFKEADIFMLTSYFEGFARVIMEAALAGVPVVTTKISGISGIVTHDVSGFVFEQGDESGFIQAIKTLITNQNKRIMMGRAIRDAARSTLSTSMMLEKQKQIHNYLETL